MSDIDNNAEYIARLTGDYEKYLKGFGNSGDWTIDDFMKALNKRANSILDETRKNELPRL